MAVAAIVEKAHVVYKHCLSLYKVVIMIELMGIMQDTVLAEQLDRPGSISVSTPYRPDNLTKGQSWDTQLDSSCHHTSRSLIIA